MKKDFTYSVPWNLLLITAGSLLYSAALKGIAKPQGFIPSGLFGVSVLVAKLVGHLGAGPWFMLLNIPMFLLGWFLISKRFLYYSLYAMLVTAVSYSLFQVNFGIHDQLYAAVSCGVLSGAGAGIVLRSLGSGGGLDVVGIILLQRFNIGLGKFYFVFNLLLFTFSFFTLSPDLVIASLIMVFVSSVAVEYCLSLFNQRKVVFVISERPEAVAEEIMDKLRIGATFLDGQGAYQKQYKKLLMTVINNVQLKRLEEIVFTHDPYALFIVENTFNVIGASFSRRKIY